MSVTKPKSKSLDQNDSGFVRYWNVLVAYADESHVIHSQKVWIANTATDAGNEPGVSGKWDAAGTGGGGGSTADAITVEKTGTPSFDDVQDHINLSNEIGIISGGIIADAGGLDVSVTNGEGRIRASSLATSILKAFNWSGLSDLTLTDDATNLVYIDYNSGIPILGAATNSPLPTLDEYLSKIVLAIVVTSSGSISSIDNTVRISLGRGGHVERAKVAQLLYSENGKWRANTGIAVFSDGLEIGGQNDFRTAGFQQWGFTVAKTAASASGLANDATTYTASISVDGTPNAISIVGSASQTLQTVIDEINADLSGATASFNATDNGFIKITSDSIGESSTIAITDTDLFGSLTDANGAADTAVPGTDLVGLRNVSGGLGVNDSTGKSRFDVNSTRTRIGNTGLAGRLEIHTGTGNDVVSLFASTLDELHIGEPGAGFTRLKAALEILFDNAGGQQTKLLHDVASERLRVTDVSGAYIAPLDDRDIVPKRYSDENGVWTKYTIAETAFTESATSEDIELFSLAAKQMIEKIVIKHSAAFTGGTLSAFTLSVGIVGDLTKYAAAFDVFQAIGATVFQLSETAGIENFGDSTSIRLAAVSTGDDVVNANTGSVDVWVFTSKLN